MKTTIYIVMVSTGEYSDRTVSTRTVSTWRAYNTLEESKREVERLEKAFKKIGLYPFMGGGHDYAGWANKIRSADLGNPDEWMTSETPTWYVEPCELIVERNAK